MAAPIMNTYYPAAPKILIGTITIYVLDIGGNVAVFNSSAAILVDVTSTDMSLSGPLTATLSSNGTVMFNNVSLVMPQGGNHVLYFTSDVNSSVSLISTSITITVGPGNPYQILPATYLSYNTSVQCSYLFWW
jgi:hypothetical protein